MKNFYQSCLALAMTVSLVLTGCSDKEVGTKNYLEYEGQSYELNVGTLISMETEEGVYSHSVNLTNVGTGMTSFDLDMEVIMLVLNFNSPDETLEAGTYSFSEGFTNTGFSGGFSFGQKLDGSSLGTQVFLEGGAITVGRDGEQYTLELNIIAEEGKEIQGYYNGRLQTDSTFDF